MNYPPSIEFLLLFIGMVLALATSYTDWKWREIWDHFTVPIIIVGLSINIFLSNMDMHSYLQYCGILFGVLVFSGFLHVLGLWGDGDVMLMLAYASLFAYSPSFARNPAPYAVDKPLFILSVILNMYLVALVIFTAKYLREVIRWKNRNLALQNSWLIPVPYAPLMAIGWFIAVFYGDLFWMIIKLLVGGI